MMKQGNTIKQLGVLLLVVGMAACATEKPVEPKKRWDVKAFTGGVPKTWVWKLDGSKQCVKAKPALNDETALKELKNRGVLTFNARAGNSGRMMTAVCGAYTGRTVEVEIAISDLPKAEEMGYKQKATQN